MNAGFKKIEIEQNKYEGEGADELNKDEFAWGACACLYKAC